MPLIPTVGKQKQVDLSEFKANLFCIVSFRTDRAMQRYSVSNKTNNPEVIKTGLRDSYLHIQLFTHTHMIRKLSPGSLPHSRGGVLLETDEGE